MTRRLRFYSNISDPRVPNYERYIWRRGKQTLEEAISIHHKWLRSKVIGEPKISYANQGYVGVYGFEMDEYAKNDPTVMVDYQGWLMYWNQSRACWVTLTDQQQYVASLDFKLTFDKNTCLDCKGSGEYKGFMTIEECHRCKGKGTTYPLAC